MKGGDFYAQETHALAGGGDGPVPDPGDHPRRLCRPAAQDTPVFEEIVPYSLYIKNQGCDLMISDRTAFIEGWVSGQTGRSTECEVRVELQQKSGSFAWILVDSWTDRQDGTRASVSETVSVTPGETYRVKAVVTVWAGSDSETATIYSEIQTA